MGPNGRGPYRTCEAGSTRDGDDSSGSLVLLRVRGQPPAQPRTRAASRRDGPDRLSPVQARRDPQIGPPAAGHPLQHSRKRVARQLQFGHSRADHVLAEDRGGSLAERAGVHVLGEVSHSVPSIVTSAVSGCRTAWTPARPSRPVRQPTGAGHVRGQCQDAIGVEGVDGTSAPIYRPGADPPAAADAPHLGRVMFVGSSGANGEIVAGRRRAPARPPCRPERPSVPQQCAWRFRSYAGSPRGRRRGSFAVS